MSTLVTLFCSVILFYFSPPNQVISTTNFYLNLIKIVLSSSITPIQSLSSLLHFFNCRNSETNIFPFILLPSYVKVITPLQVDQSRSIRLHHFHIHLFFSPAFIHLCFLCVSFQYSTLFSMFMLSAYFITAFVDRHLQERICFLWWLSLDFTAKWVFAKLAVHIWSLFCNQFTVKTRQCTNIFF